MARVPYRSAEELPEEHRELLSRPINLFRGLANSPEAFSRFHALGEWIRWDCELDPRLRELVILQVGYLTHSSYEFSHHIEIGRKFGVTDEDVHGLIDLAAGRPTHFTDEEQDLLEATTRLTEETAVPDDLWNRLAERMSPARLVDFVVVAAFYSMVVRVLATLQIDVEPDYAQYLDKFPLRSPV
ncbi:carboxymuconolactone decarboxylase family protein [Mycobacterium neglectum]|uniref:carboxymuconolactone decarboxylase family protein n=1 Tax=Mycobacterium neglectum TaxID=242737 RepID=UPI000BFEF7EB|nr:carboxymuconolactone decarboxylase family protein [Mycobacterium neglectum]